MATAYIGQIHEFNPDIMKWDIYMERAETFFALTKFVCAKEAYRTILGRSQKITFNTLHAAS